MEKGVQMRFTGILLILVVFLCLNVRGVLAADTASIQAKSDDGAYLALDDGTKWIVSSSDRSTVSTWTVGDDVVYVEDSKNCTNTEIINTDEDGDEICVKPLAN